MYSLDSFTATDQIATRYLNRWVKAKICGEGMDYLYELAAVLLGGEGVTQLRIINHNNKNDISACFTDFFRLWNERDLDATWQKLIDALEETNRTKLATQIRNALTPPVMVTLPQQGVDQQQQVPPAAECQPNREPLLQVNRPGDNGGIAIASYYILCHDMNITI